MLVTAMAYYEALRDSLSQQDGLSDAEVETEVLTMAGIGTHAYFDGLAADGHRAQRLLQPQLTTMKLRARCKHRADATGVGPKRRPTRLSAAITRLMAQLSAQQLVNATISRFLAELEHTGQLATFDPAGTHERRHGSTHG